MGLFVGCVDGIGCKYYNNENKSLEPNVREFQEIGPSTDYYSCVEKDGIDIIYETTRRNYSIRTVGLCVGCGVGIDCEYEIETKEIVRTYVTFEK